MRAGLIDEVSIDLMLVLIGEGIRFFDHLGPGQIELKRTKSIEGSGVTHLRFRVAK